MSFISVTRLLLPENESAPASIGIAGAVRRRCCASALPSRSLRGVDDAPAIPPISVPAPTAHKAQYSAAQRNLQHQVV